MKYLSLSLAVAGTLAGAPLAAQEKLEEIVVIASRVETPLREVGASVSVVALEEIELRGYPTVAQLLRTQAGISVSNSGGAGKQTALRIRGEDGFRTLVLIDGVDVSDPTAPQVGPLVENLTTGSEIERIEVLRGPQGFIYGADAGGVVQVVTRRVPSGVEGQLGLEGGRYGSQKMNAFVAAGNQKFDGFFSAADWSTDGFNSIVEDTQGDADGYSNTTLHGKFGWNPSPDLRVQVVLRDIDAVNQYDVCYNEQFQRIHDCTGELAQSTGRISLDHTAGAFSHQVAFSSSSMERDNFSGDYLAFGTKGALKKAEYVARVKASDAVAVVFGGDTEMERVHVVDGDDLSRYQLGMFGEFQFGLDDRIFFTGGVRYDENEDFGEHLSARLTSAYLLPAGDNGILKLRASAGNGFRAPSLYEVTTNRNAIVPMAELKEESSSGYDLGLEYYRDSGLSAQLTWFEQSTEDEIIYDMQNWTGYLQADGRSHSKGVELQFSLPIANWAQLDTVFTRNLTQTSLDQTRIHRPGKTANVSLYLYPAESLVILLNNRWESDVLDVDRQPMDSYQVLDLSATFTLVPGWEVFGRVENALDEEYQEVSGYYTSRRAGYIGTRFSF
jgi:Outer membrane cobalamin receptor protein